MTMLHYLQMMGDCGGAQLENCQPKPKPKPKPKSKSQIPCPNRPQILTLSSDQV